MNSHAHTILELPAPKEVSMIWDLNMSASFSGQEFSRFTRSRDRQSATNTPSYRCCPVLLSLHRLAAPLYRYIAQRERERERERESERERQREREPERERERRTERGRGGQKERARETDRQRERETGRERETERLKI